MQSEGREIGSGQRGSDENTGSIGGRMEKLLSEFNIGEEGVIRRVGGDGRVRRRLFDMGITPGAEVRMVKMAPLGDPMEVNVRNYELTLRKSEAALVIMEVRR